MGITTLIEQTGKSCNLDGIIKLLPPTQLHPLISHLMMKETQRPRFVIIFDGALGLGDPAFNKHCGEDPPPQFHYSRKKKCGTGRSSCGTRLIASRYVRQRWVP